METAVIHNRPEKTYKWLTHNRNTDTQDKLSALMRLRSHFFWEFANYPKGSPQRKHAGKRIVKINEDMLMLIFSTGRRIIAGSRPFNLVITSDWTRQQKQRYQLYTTLMELESYSDSLHTSPDGFSFTLDLETA